jgi:hypothetical protein
MQSKTAEKGKYNRKTYDVYIFRVRRESQLAARLREHVAEGETSVTFLITIGLCFFLGCPVPHRKYTRTQRTRLI